MGISPVDFDFIVGLVHRRLGIRLEADKGYLVESRFRRIYERMGLLTIGEFVERLLLVAAGVLGQAVGVVVLVHLPAHDLVELLGQSLCDVDVVLGGEGGGVRPRLEGEQAGHGGLRLD